MPFIKNITIQKSRSYIGSISIPVVIGKVGAGSNFSLFINGNTGRAWGWGLNSLGQLGDNTTTCKCTPVSVLGTTKTFCQIAGGGSHTIAIDKNGGAWAWGTNTNGQLGDNTLVSKRTPVSVLGTTKTFCQISGGSNYTIAIDKNGRAWAWGNNGAGQLGINSLVLQQTPVSVLGTTKTFCEITAGICHTIAIDRNGRAWSWGLNSAGQLGDGTVISKLTPVSVIGTVKTFCKITTGASHTIVIDKNGRLWGWGGRSFGQVGDNTSAFCTTTPVCICGAIKTFCKISAGACHTLAIDKNGRLWAWGRNVWGELGDGTLIQRNTPVSVVGTVKTFCEIATGTCHSLAIDKSGIVWAWGNNGFGVLGNNINGLSKCTPVSVYGTKTFCQIATGGAFFTSHISAIDQNGRVWAWGNNLAGQLANNSTSVQYSPVSILGVVKTFCKINVGACHTVAIDKNGRAWAWGFNGQGQLGDNSLTSRRTPVSVLGTTKTFCQIAGGSSHTIAIDKNGRVWAWGLNTNGQLGDNTLLSKRTPVSVLGTTKTFCSIYGGNLYSTGIDKDGIIWSWGLNSTGQLGDNTLLSKTTPVSLVGTRKTFCKIGGGGAHNTAIDQYGQVWAWGSNGSGQLGDNTSTQKCTPVSLAGVKKTFCEIVGTNSHTLAIDKNGRLWAWGVNSVGQLGDNSITQRLTPVSVAGGTKTFCKIGVIGSGTSYAIDKNGRLWSWGQNLFGQVGDFTLFYTTPIRVCTI